MANESYTATQHETRVFWGCFIALVTCAFGFVVRTQVVGEWQIQFNLSETEKGDILGVGFWPFAFSIFLFSLIIDKVGYGRAALVGFLLHVSSVLLLVLAKNAAMLYWGTFLFALSNGTVEAYINPVVSTMHPKNKSGWLNILHAGWSGGIVLAGILSIALGGVPWQWKIALISVPTLAYGVILLGTKFPVSERVAAGVSYRTMLQDFGALGTFVAVYLISLQICDGILKVQDGKFLWPLLPALVSAAIFGAYTRSLGRPLYFLLLLVMLPLATTELGVDSWITPLMGPEMAKVGIPAGWVLVYTAAIMTVLRLFAAPLVNRVSPLGLLAGGALLAIVGLSFLSVASGAVILLAATVYGVGKAFFWPTMLGVVAERFPRGGALTLNCIGGVGMLGLSVGMVFLGNVQDQSVAAGLTRYDAEHRSDLRERYLTEQKTSVFGGYRALDQRKLQEASASDRAQVEALQAGAKKSALATAAYLPVLMLLVYVGLLFYFRARGGYRTETLEAAESVGAHPTAA